MIHVAPQRTPSDHYRAAPGRVTRSNSSPRHVQQVVRAADDVPRTVPTGAARGPVPVGHCGSAQAGPAGPVSGPDTNCCRRRNRWSPRSASSGQAHRRSDQAPCSLPLVAELRAGGLGTYGTIIDSKDTTGARTRTHRIRPAGWQCLRGHNGDENRLPGWVPLRCWTCAHHERPRPKIDVVERRECRLLIDGHWCHATPSPAESRVHHAKREDELTEVAGMSCGTGRPVGVPRDEDLLPGRQRQDERRLGPVEVNPVDQPVDQGRCGVGDELSTARPCGSPPTWVARGHLLRDPMVGVDADEESGCRHGLMVAADRGGNPTTRCPSGDARMKPCPRRPGFGQCRGWPPDSPDGVRSPGIRGLSTSGQAEALLDVT